MGFIKEFREFAVKGNMVDMAVGIIVGSAFGAVVASLVADVLMPPIGALIAGVDFSNMSFKINGFSDDTPIEIKYGLFINALIKFTITAFAVFLLVKVINTARARFEKQKEAAPAAPSREEVLLTEIRDLLAKGR